MSGERHLALIRLRKVVHRCPTLLIVLDQSNAWLLGLWTRVPAGGDMLAGFGAVGEGQRLEWDGPAATVMHRPGHAVCGTQYQKFDEDFKQGGPAAAG